MPPSVSVIIPVFNRLEYPIRAVTSVAEQSYRDFELIVVDDGSTINLDALRGVTERCGGQYFCIEHQGVSGARNYGVQQSRANLIAFLDSDDTWMPNKLEQQLNYLKKNPNCKICQTKEIWIRNDRFVNAKYRHQQPDGEAFFPSLKMCCISPSSVLIERELFLKSGGFDKDLRVCEDYDLWLRITAFYPVGLINQPLIKKFGGHSDQLSKSEPAMDRFRVYAMLKVLLTISLSKEKLNALISELRLKTEILLKGALKREDKETVAVYQDIFGFVQVVERDNVIDIDRGGSVMLRQLRLITEN